jgi:hypothetical protein
MESLEIYTCKKQKAKIYFSNRYNVSQYDYLSIPILFIHEKGSF